MASESIAPEPERKNATNLMIVTKALADRAAITAGKEDGVAMAACIARCEENTKPIVSGGVNIVQMASESVRLLRVATLLERFRGQSHSHLPSALCVFYIVERCCTWSIRRQFTSNHLHHASLHPELGRDSLRQFAILLSAQSAPARH
jgi:hypothetical protein